MPHPAPGRLVGLALRCYPVRWRGRHGEEAAELAGLLMRDGVPAYSIVFSYLKGAAREQCAPGRRLGVAVGAFLVAVCSLGIQLALMSTPASAESNARAALTRIGCSGLVGETVAQALPALRSLDVRIVWSVAGRGGLRSVPPGPGYVAGDSMLYPATVVIHVTADRPASEEPGGHGERC